MLVSVSRNKNSLSTFLVFLIILGSNILFSIWDASKEYSSQNSFPTLKIIISSCLILILSILLTTNFQKLKFIGKGDGIVGIMFLTFMLGFKDSYLFCEELFALLIIVIVNI